MSFPSRLQDIPHPTPSCGISQVAQPQINLQVQRLHGSVQHTQSNEPAQNSSQHQNVEDNYELNNNSDEEPFEECEVGIEDESGVRNKRGITRFSDIWNLPPAKRIVVKFNAAFVPVGDEGGLFNRFIAVMSRKPHLCPINCKSWHKVPSHYKEACWSIIESKFVIPENNLAKERIKHYTLKLLGTRLRDWRCTLKNKYFDESKTATEIIATAPPTVNEEQFADLVSYWFSDEGKNLSLKNKRERDWTESGHISGSKSYARHADEMEVDSGFVPSRAKLYIKTHRYPNGTAVNKAAAANIVVMEELMKLQPNGLEEKSKGSIYWSPDDIYSQVIAKKEWHGRVRGCGFGPTPKSSGSTCNGSSRFNVVNEEEIRRDKETISKLENTVQVQQAEISKLEENGQSQQVEISTLKEQVAFLMRQV